MLKAFRQQGLTSAVYGALIVATVMVFVIQFRPGAQGRSGSIKQECAAEIRGRCIEPKEYQAEFMLTAPGRMIDASTIKALNVRKAVLDGIVERTLLVQDAERLGITISEDELDNELVAGRAHVSLPVDRAPLGGRLGLVDNSIRMLPVINHETKQFDYKTYDRIVRQFSNRSPTEFKVMQREELIAARVRDLVRARVRVGDDEAFTGYQREKSSATIRFVAFRRDWFAHHVLDLSPAAIDAWVKDHKDEVDKIFETRKSQYLPECRSARHILIKVADEATDEQKAAAETKINSILERVRKGEDFAKVAREESDDSSASEGGDLQCFQRGRMVKPFEDTVFALAPGQISDVVKTQFGYHVIKLGAKLPARTRSFEEVRLQLQNELGEKRAQTEAERRGKTLGEKIRGLSNTSDDELRKLQDDAVKYETSEWIAKGEPVTGLGANPAVTAEAWSLKIGQVSKEPISTPRGPVFLKPAEERPAGIPPFEEVKAKVSADFVGDRRSKEAQDKLAPAAKELASGATLASLAARYETEVKTTPEFGPGGNVPEIGNAPALANAVFAAAKGGSGGPVEVPDGFVLFRVLTRTSAEPSLLTAQKQEITDSLRQREADRLLRSYLAQMRTEKRVEVNEELLKSFLPEAGASRRIPAG